MEDGGPGHMGTVVQTTVDPHVYMVKYLIYIIIVLKTNN